MRFNLDFGPRPGSESGVDEPGRSQPYEKPSGPTYYMTSTIDPTRTTPQVAVNDIGTAEDFLAAIDRTIEYFNEMLALGVPNVEMHIYGNGRHPGDPLPDGTRMSGGLTDRNDTPFGTWQYRFIDWFRDLGFLQKPGVETKAAKDVATLVSQPPAPAR